MLTYFKFSLLVVFVFFGFRSNKLLNTSLNVVQDSRVVFLLNRGVFLKLDNLTFTIVNQGGILGTLPVLSERLHNLQNETLLINSELAVLAHGVQADNIFLFSCDKRCKFIFRPITDLRLKKFTCSFSSFLLLNLLVFKLVNLFLKLLLAGSHILEISQSGFKSLIRQARLVNERYGHERS